MTTAAWQTTNWERQDVLYDLEVVATRCGLVGALSWSTVSWICKYVESYDWMRDHGYAQQMKWAVAPGEPTPQALAHAARVTEQWRAISARANCLGPRW